MLLLVMLAVTGLAIDEQRWMGTGPDGASQTGMLPLLMVAAGITGAILAWSRLSARLGGPRGGPGGHRRRPAVRVGSGLGRCRRWLVRLEALNESLATVPARCPGERCADPRVVGVPVDRQRACLDIRGRSPAISIFRRSNAAGAIVPIGAMLMLQLLASGRPQDIWLVLFAGASLLLVLRLDLESQRDSWLRRRIGGGQGVGGLFLRGGAAVVACMLVGSLLLASVASTSSVAAAFPQLEALVDDLASRVQGLVGVAAPPVRGTNGQFPRHRPIKASWRPKEETAFVAEPLEGGRHYWRVASWDAFDGQSWDQTASSTQDVATGEDLLEQSEDAVSTGSDRLPHGHRDHHLDHACTASSCRCPRTRCSSTGMPA